MKELETFREFLAEEQLDENKLAPSVIKLLKALQPEEAPGSWDSEKSEFVVPFNYENLDYTEEDLKGDSRLEAYKVDVNDLPKEYVEFETYSVGVNQGKETTAKNFAKYVPGEGLYFKMTTEH